MSDRDHGSLLHLPAELVQMLWNGLREHQPSLRSTCRTLRDATTPLITKLQIDISQQRRSRAILRQSMKMLAAFPSAATLTTMKYRYMHGPAIDMHGVLPLFFMRSANRLASLVDVSFHMTAVSSHAWCQHQRRGRLCE